MVPTHQRDRSWREAEDRSWPKPVIAREKKSGVARQFGIAFDVLS